MVKKQSTILTDWPALQEDLGNFLADTDAWVIAELKRAQRAKDWREIGKIIDVMDFVHSMSHEH